MTGVTPVEPSTTAPAPPAPAPTSATGPARPAPRLSFLRFLLWVPKLITSRAEAIRGIAQEGGPVVRVPVPGKPFYLVSCPRHARQLLLTNNKNYRKSFDWRIVHSLLGDGLVTSHDEVWRHARAAIAPSFRADPVARMTGPLARVVREEVAAWQPGVAPITTATTRLALRAFTSAALDVEATPTELRTIADSVAAGLRHLDGRLAALVDLEGYLPFLGGGFRRSRARLDAVIHAWIDAREARGPGQDLLSVLLQASKHLPATSETGPLQPRRWLRDQLVTFLLAGHETVAVSLTWCLYLLAHHPDVQRRLRELVRGSEPDAAWLSRWSELDAVIHEALRLYPPVWSLGREAVAADRFDDLEVPAGSTVMVSPYAIHRRADLWPEPDAFRPERFAGGPPKHTDALTWLPFSAGPRFCPGEALALNELKLALREVLLRFEVAPLDARPIATEALISFRPKRELKLRLTPVA